MNRKLLIFGVAISLYGTVLTSCGNSGLTVSNDVLVIGMEANYQPFNWTTYTSSEYTLPIYGTNEYADGYDVAIAKHLSDEIGKDVYIKRIVWDSLIPSLQQDEVNLVLAGMTDTPERRKSIDFTDPYLTSDLAFLIRTEDMPEGYGTKENPASYEQLLELFDGQTLVCQANVVGDGFIDTYFVNNNHGKTIRHANPQSTYPSAANEVKGGVSFAMPAELPVIETMTNLGGLSVLYCDYKSFLSEEDLNGLSVSIGVKKGNAELADEINAALSKLSDEERNKMMGDAASRSAENA